MTTFLCLCVFVAVVFWACLKSGSDADDRMLGDRQYENIEYHTPKKDDPSAPH